MGLNPYNNDFYNDNDDDDDETDIDGEEKYGPTGLQQQGDDDDDDGGALRFERLYRCPSDE